jgi:hypothetical protein
VISRGNSALSSNVEGYKYLCCPDWSGRPAFCISTSAPTMNNTFRGSHHSLHTPDVEGESIISHHGPLAYHGFWDKDHESTQDRVLYIKVLTLGSAMIVIIIMWCILPIYWGSVWSAPQHIHNLNGWLVVCVLSFFSTLPHDGPYQS